MLIKELFEIIENSNLFDIIEGDFEYHKKYILWKYDLKDIESDYYVDYNIDVDDDYENYGFDNISNEETLLDIYNEDFNQLKLFLDEINEIDNFIISDPNIKKTSISFRITN